MKNQVYLLSILFCLLYLQISGQPKLIYGRTIPKYGYGILFYENGVLCKNQKKEFILFLKSIECLHTNEPKQDAIIDVFCIGNESYNGNYIDGVYRVGNIKKKTDNFFIDNNKLKKKTIYIIELYCVDKDFTLPYHVKLISFKQDCKDGSLIKKNRDYQLSLFQIFGDDFTKPLQERKIIAIGHGMFENCFYKELFIRYLEIGSNYYVESPDIKGLYYIKPDVNDSLQLTPKNQKDGLGGSYNNNYNYDDLYRLVNSDGSSHNLSMEYSPNGKIERKEQTANYNINGEQYTSSTNYVYEYFPNTNKLNNINGGEQHFRWDANGNMQTRENAGNYRRHCWDEENRLIGMKEGKVFGYYIYDSNGERSYKLNGNIVSYNVNGENFNQAVPTMATLYASPYIVATPQGYTKHYYVGSERITSKIGTIELIGLGMPIVEEDIIMRKQYYSNHLTEQAWQNCMEMPNPEKLELDVLYQHINNPAMRALPPETDLYFYHPDHLGSSSWITDIRGRSIQHLQYLPFDETRVDQRTTSWNTRYSFSAKEKDEESGYGYFGARYLDCDLSIWLSVDPMSDKYPYQTSYLYCGNNPLKIIDPNGKDEYEFDKKGNLTNVIENKKADILRVIDEDGNKTESKEFAPKTIEKNKTQTYSPDENKSTSTYDYYKVRGDNNGTEMFEYNTPQK